MSTAAISMTFTNYSQTTLQRGYWGCELEDGFGSLNQSPGPTLIAESGQEVMSASQILSSLDTGPYDIECTWVNTQTNERFGVKLYVPFQMLHIGKAPYWYVSYDQEGMNNTEPNWISSGSDPSDQFTWPQSIGFNIVATPDAGHTSLSVQIVIQDQ
ncbi:MAG: hypothetical protein V4801_28050 [Burkholderia gladioli]